MKLRQLRIMSASQWLYDAAERLGLTGMKAPSPWTKNQLQSAGLIARYLSTGDTLTAMLIADTQKQITILNDCIERMRDLIMLTAKSPQECAAAASAASALASLERTHKEKQQLLIELVKMLQDDKAPEFKKLNLPPTVALQVNVAGGANPSPPPAIPATFGKPTVEIIQKSPPPT